ncbi:MAG: 2-oxo acid dehydrogenase subunit E2 [Clostridiales bacterium]|nr:2-oxo acid dehydrogenase subunit E2 [Clostridiales bacterium]
MYKRRWGDRRDGRWVREMKGLNTILGHLLPNRTDCEVFLNEKLDATELVNYLEQKRLDNPDIRLTLFHCFVTAFARMVNERPLMNRFVQGRRTYERYETSLAFVAKRQFSEKAEESLIFLIPKSTDTVTDIAKKIVGDVKDIREKGNETGGIDNIVDALAKLPRPILMFIIKIIRIMDYWGINPRFLTDGDPNYASVFITNLGSIKCPAVYHHLNNYGTNSIMVAIGTLHDEELVMPDGHKEIRKVVEIGATLDERIADGFYFARSLKLVKHILSHPELLDVPLNVNSGFAYE